VALSHVLSEIFNVEKCQDLEIRVRSLKVIESGTIQQIGYDFLLVLFSNFVPKMHRFLRYSTCNCTVTLKRGLGVTQSHEK